jgi:hypothetical protein
MLASICASLSSASSVEKPKNDQKQDGTDCGNDNGHHDPGGKVALYVGRV